MGHCLISAAHKSSGKTTVTMGICALLRQQGKRVQPFKKGPDYIDPMWLSASSGQACYNLDFNTMDLEEIETLFSQRSMNSDLAIIEGNKGLYDGLNLDGSNSNAALAKLLKTPVILVIDARGMTRGIAPIILGFQNFDTDIKIAGVILNQLGGSRHESKLRAVIEHYTDVPVIGAVHFSEKLRIVERHLGLIPSNEIQRAAQTIQQISTLIEAQIDLEKFLAIVSQAPNLSFKSKEMPSQKLPATLRIGVARDSAFGFYYPDDLEQMSALGVELVFVDLLHQKQLPLLDGLFIGGGFPETHMEQLAANETMKNEVKNAIESGLPVYAECGGLMYLSRSLQWGERKVAMAGVIAGDIVMESKPQGRGYVRFEETEYCPWPKYSDMTQSLAAHEFHYSKIVNLPVDTRFAYKVLRGYGINGEMDGIVYKNMLACYSHARHTRNNPWVSRFVDFVKQHREQLLKCITK